jgi:hypothetical protein
MPLSVVWMSCTLWYSPYAKCVIWVCSNSECPEGSRQVGVSRRVWLRVKAVNSSGVRVEKACCHMVSRGLSGVGFGGESACCEGSVVVLLVGALCRLGFIGWPPPRGFMSCGVCGVRSVRVALVALCEVCLCLYVGVVGSEWDRDLLCAVLFDSLFVWWVLGTCVGFGFSAIFGLELCP